jgi:hypothetical protein
LNPASAGGDPNRRLIVECAAAFAAATAVAALLFHLAPAIPFLAQNLQGFVAAVFIYLPVWSARRHGDDLSAYGFTTRPRRRSLAFGLVGPALVFPLFLVGFVLFYQWVCARPALAGLAPAGWCARFVGWSGLLHPRAPADLLLAVVNQVIVVALPEELFFRGYLLGLLERALPPRRRLLGGGLGAALVLSAALFAVGHVLVDLDPRRLATFVPGLLFGWMRSATGSIAAGTFVHASANLFMESLQRTFVGG